MGSPSRVPCDDGRSWRSRHTEVSKVRHDLTSSEQVRQYMCMTDQHCRMGLLKKEKAASLHRNGRPPEDKDHQLIV